MSTAPRIEWRATNQEAEPCTRKYASELLRRGRTIDGVRVIIIAPHVYRIGTEAVPEHATIVAR